MAVKSTTSDALLAEFVDAETLHIPWRDIAPDADTAWQNYFEAIDDVLGMKLLVDRSIPVGREDFTPLHDILVARMGSVGGSYSTDDTMFPLLSATEVMNAPVSWKRQGYESISFGEPTIRGSLGNRGLNPIKVNFGQPNVVDINVFGEDGTIPSTVLWNISQLNLVTLAEDIHIEVTKGMEYLKIQYHVQDARDLANTLQLLARTVVDLEHSPEDARFGKAPDLLWAYHREFNHLPLTYKPNRYVFGLQEGAEFASFGDLVGISTRPLDDIVDGTIIGNSLCTKIRNQPDMVDVEAHEVMLLTHSGFRGEMYIAQEDKSFSRELLTALQELGVVVDYGPAELGLHYMSDSLHRLDARAYNFSKAVEGIANEYPFDGSKDHIQRVIEHKLTATDRDRIKDAEVRARSLTIQQANKKYPSMRRHVEDIDFVKVNLVYDSVSQLQQVIRTVASMARERDPINLQSAIMQERDFVPSYYDDKSSQSADAGSESAYIGAHNTTGRMRRPNPIRVTFSSSKNDLILHIPGKDRRKIAQSFHKYVDAQGLSDFSDDEVDQVARIGINIRDQEQLNAIVHDVHVTTRSGRKHFYDKLDAKLRGLCKQQGIDPKIADSIVSSRRKLTDVESASGESASDLVLHLTYDGSDKGYHLYHKFGTNLAELSKELEVYQDCWSGPEWVRPIIANGLGMVEEDGLGVLLVEGGQNKKHLSDEAVAEFNDVRYRWFERLADRKGVPVKNLLGSQLHNDYLNLAVFHAAMKPFVDKQIYSEDTREEIYPWDVIIARAAACQDEDMVKFLLSQQANYEIASGLLGEGDVYAEDRTIIHNDFRRQNRIDVPSGHIITPGQEANAGRMIIDTQLSQPGFSYMDGSKLETSIEQIRHGRSPTLRDTDGIRDVAFFRECAEQHMENNFEYSGEQVDDIERKVALGSFVASVRTLSTMMNWNNRGEYGMQTYQKLVAHNLEVLKSYFPGRFA